MIVPSAPQPRMGGKALEEHAKALEHAVHGPREGATTLVVEGCVLMKLGERSWGSDGI